MFSAGYTLTLILHGKISALRFFFCLYFPVMCYLIYLVFLFFYKRFSTYTPLFSHHCTQKSADQVIFDSLHSIFMIGICIMIFSIAVSLLEILPLPFYLKRGLTAVLEITNAISYFGSSHMSISRKVILLCMITSFGGLSAAVQTLSVYKKSRLSLWKYLLIRSLFSVSSGLLAYLVFI